MIEELILHLSKIHPMPFGIKTSYIRWLPRWDHGGCFNIHKIRQAQIRVNSLDMIWWYGQESVVRHVMAIVKYLHSVRQVGCAQGQIFFFMENPHYHIKSHPRNNFHQPGADSNLVYGNFH